MFRDSKVAQKFSCGRTKSTKIGENVLAAASKEYILADINQRKFAIATDASNKGNVKTFPLIVTYFTKSDGICTKLLSFFNLESETSKSIASALQRALSAEKLDMKNVTGYSADNAAVNFAKNQSVFTELTKFNKHLLPMGCCCHILNNTAKKAVSLLRFDIENIIIMCYNEFSSSTKNSTELKGNYLTIYLIYLPKLRIHNLSIFHSLSFFISFLYFCVFHTNFKLKKKSVKGRLWSVKLSDNIFQYFSAVFCLNFKKRTLHTTPLLQCL